MQAHLPSITKSSLIRPKPHSQKLLLKGGVALIHDANDRVKGVKTDILIENNKISRIAQDIDAFADAEVIDCTNKLISPGFIDTHHHLWQTQLRGRHANEVLLEYMVSGNLQSSNYTREDIYWGQLGGCMEAINAGTTTVVDHSHVNCFTDAAPTAISATASSGIRCIYGYCPTPRVTSWSPLTMAQDILAPWVMDTFQDLAMKAPFGDGRVTLGLAFDLWFLPAEIIKDVFRRAKEFGVEVVTTHFVRNVQVGTTDCIAQIKELGLLDSKLLFSHGNGASAENVRAIAEAGAHISSTPSAEMQMAVGIPVCFSNELPDVQKQSSLGIDCHSNQAGSIVYEMRLGLQASRAMHNQKILDQGKAPRHVYKTVEEAFNLGTIQGARAIRMDDKIGSIAVGKLADLVIFDGNSPGMVCAVDQDPVAAVVLHSSIADVEMVIVDGRIKKRAGKLGDIEIEEGMRDITGESRLEWGAVADALRRTRETILERIEKIDLVEARKGVVRNFHIDESKLV